MSKGINIFEVATRNKYRFPYRGQISVEDMWDLPVTELDKIFKTLNKQVKTSQELASPYLRLRIDFSEEHP